MQKCQLVTLAVLVLQRLLFRGAPSYLKSKANSGNWTEGPLMQRRAKLISNSEQRCMGTHIDVRKYTDATSRVR